jgi:hypothetical protein
MTGRPVVACFTAATAAPLPLVLLLASLVMQCVLDALSNSEQRARLESRARDGSKSGCNHS